MTFKCCVGATTAVFFFFRHCCRMDKDRVFWTKQKLLPIFVLFYFIRPSIFNIYSYLYILYLFVIIWNIILDKEYFIGNRCIVLCVLRDKELQRLVSTRQKNTTTLVDAMLHHEPLCGIMTAHFIASGSSYNKNVLNNVT